MGLGKSESTRNLETYLGLKLNTHFLEHDIEKMQRLPGDLPSASLLPLALLHEWVGARPSLAP